MKFVEGMRIRLGRMVNDPDPLPVGATGTITSVFQPAPKEAILSIKWDAPNERRKLNVLFPEDTFQIIKE